MALRLPDEVGVEVVVAPVLKGTPFCRRWITPSRFEAIVIENSVKSTTIREGITRGLSIFGECECCL